MYNFFLTNTSWSKWNHIRMSNSFRNVQTKIVFLNLKDSKLSQILNENTRVSQKFHNILVSAHLQCIIRGPNQFKLWKLPTVVGSIVVVSVLTCCILLHSMKDLKAVQINVQCSLIQELILYKFELGNNIMEATENICERGRCSWSPYSNQIVQEIFLRS